MVFSSYNGAVKEHQYHFQLCVFAVMGHAGVVNVILDPAVNIRVTDGISDVMAEIAAEISNSLFALLAERDFCSFF